MAAAVGRICGAGLLKTNSSSIKQISKLSTATRGWTKGQKYMLTTLGVVGGSVGTLWFALEQSIKASGTEVHPPKNPWTHYGVLSSYDHNSIRRGYEVYKQVCAACHSLKYIAYRNLIGVSHTEEEAKAEAEEVMIKDGPNDVGEYYMRPGKLSDYFPSPYPNEEAARAANNGSYPPDLSYIVAARKGGEDYVFALLTGYTEAPAGIQLREGQYFNPYFAGGAISMAQALYNEAIEYSDGTPPTGSQLAKDVTAFLKWASEPEHDERKLVLIKIVSVCTVIGLSIYYVYRHKWTAMKSRKIAFKPRS